MTNRFRFLLPGCLIIFNWGALGAAKTEKEAQFIPGAPDPAMGASQGTGAISAAQVVPVGHGKYQVLLLRGFDTESNVVAVLRGVATNGGVAFSGSGWTALISDTSLRGQGESGKFELRHITRTSP